MYSLHLVDDLVLVILAPDAVCVCFCFFFCSTNLFFINLKETLERKLKDQGVTIEVVQLTSVQI